MHTDTQYVGDVRVNLTRQCRAPEMGVDLGVWCCGSSGRGARVAYTCGPERCERCGVN